MNVQKRPFVGKPLPLTLALSMAYASAFLAVSANAQAQTAGVASATVNYAIEQGPLEQTLISIGRESGRAIAFDAARVRSLVAAPVKGTLTADAAVRVALVGTGLTLVVKPDGTLSVTDPATVAATPEQTPPETSLRAITVVAARDQAETSFKVDRTSTSTRSDTDLMDVPASVTVVTAKVLESQQATSVKDAIGQVAGVVYTQSPQGAPAFSIRGFGQTSALSNGLQSNAATAANVAGVERIEVLKGPQAILSGGGSLGGAVNIVTKKPQADPIHELTMQYASHDDKVLGLDLSGALSEDKKLTYRLIASGERQSRNYAGYEGNKAEYVMPELRWKDETTDVIIGYSADNSRAVPSAYTFAYRGYVQPAPAQRLGNEADGFVTKTQNHFYTWTQKLSPELTFTSKMQRTDNKFSLRMRAPAFPAGGGPDRINYYDPTQQETETITLAGDHYFEFNLKSGEFSNKFTTGVSHDRTDSSQLQLQGPLRPVPVYENPSFADVNGTPSYLTLPTSKQLGGYALDLVRFGDVSLLMGARRTHYRTISSRYDFSIGSTTNFPAEELWKTTPMAGVVYSLTPTVSAYANYAEGYLPQSVVMCDGGVTAPMMTKNREAGMKFDLLESKFSVTTAVFSLEQSSVTDYVYARRCNFMKPGQDTRGFELDMAGEVYKGLNLLFNATYSTLKDKADKTLIYAARPTERASVWATYDFQSLVLRGWGMGLGVTGNNKSYLGYKYKTSTTDPVKLSGSARVDANVSYRQKDWSLMLGVKNLFDRELYDFATTDTYVPMQPPRTVTLTYKVNF